MIDKIYTPKEVADRWGIKTSTLADWRYKGIGPAFIKLGKRAVRYRESDVLEYEKQNKDSV